MANPAPGSYFSPTANATTLEALRVKKYFPPRFRSHSSRSDSRVYPAAVSIFALSAHAWNAVQLALRYATRSLATLGTSLGTAEASAAGEPEAERVLVETPRALAGRVSSGRRKRNGEPGGQHEQSYAAAARVFEGGTVPEEEEEEEEEEAACAKTRAGEGNRPGRATTRAAARRRRVSIAVLARIAPRPLAVNMIVRGETRARRRGSDILAGRDPPLT